MSYIQYLNGKGAVKVNPVQANNINNQLDATVTVY